MIERAMIKLMGNDMIKKCKGEGYVTGTIFYSSVPRLDLAHIRPAAD